MKIKKIEQFLAPGFGVNTYLIIDKDQCVLVDPGMIGPELAEELKRINLNYIILTHGHYDHIMGIRDLNVPVYVSKDDLNIVTKPEYSYSSMVGNMETYDHIEFKNIDDLDKFAGEKYKIIHTPGHTKGSVCVQLGQHLLSGDTLFVDSIGRTDLFSGNMSDLQKSLKLLVSSIGNEIIVYPGHGGKAKFKIIKQRNPYLK